MEVAETSLPLKLIPFEPSFTWTCPSETLELK